MNFKQLFKRETQEERTPCDTVNSWILENGIVHYCPICDILEYCKNGKNPDCDFHSSYGVHFDCLPSLFGVPFLKIDDPEFQSIFSYRIFVDLKGFSTSGDPRYADQVFKRN